MRIEDIPLAELRVNRANDRHGELENETAAIAWLFNNREQHMRNLAKDIVDQGAIFDPPLVTPEGTTFIVFDGNRRVTCLKLLHDPKRAPNTELQSFFHEQRDRFPGEFPTLVSCQVETDRDRVDDILYRRHTGTQNGVGQSTWDDRQKTIFVTRTGKGSGPNAADEIEKRLAAAGTLPDKKIPRSTLNRLLSAEPFRNRLGFTMKRGRFELTHDESVVMPALARVAADLAKRDLVLGDIWDVDGKRVYLDRLEREGVLPSAHHSLTASKPAVVGGRTTRPKPTGTAKPSERKMLIAEVDYGLTWPGRLQRHRQIWEELQFHLLLKTHPNAISALLRVLIELSVENYVSQAGVRVNEDDALGTRLRKVGKDLKAKGKIEQSQVDILSKFENREELISASTLNAYIHSPTFAPSPEHLVSLWDSLSDIVVHCLQA